MAELKTNLQFENVSCPVCGGNIFGEYPGPKTIFRCITKTGTDMPCSGVVCRCSGCEKVYPSTNFGKHGDVYECKTCGRVQWDYTDLKKTDDMIASIGFTLNNFGF